jgi:hypothetical protein
MYAFNAFGADHEIGLTIAGDRAVWTARLFQIYAPTHADMRGMTGTRTLPEWKRAAAGLPSPALDVDRTTDAPSVAAWDSHVCDPGALAVALKACSVIAKKDCVRNYGSVVALQGTDAVATDGFRLTWAPSGLSLPDTLCLPAATVKPLLTFLKKAKSCTAYVSEDRTSLAFVCGETGARFYARLSAVKFPQWRALVPDKFSDTVSADVLAAAKDEASVKKKAAKRSEEVLTKLGAHTFNGRFVADLPDGATARLGVTEEDPCLASSGNVSMILCPVKRPAQHTA